MGSHVRKSRNNLLFGGEVRTLLKFEIAKGAGECQVAIDPAKIDETTGSAYPCFLSCLNCKKMIPSGAMNYATKEAQTFILWFVVERQRFCSTLDPQDGS